MKSIQSTPSSTPLLPNIPPRSHDITSTHPTPSQSPSDSTRPRTIDLAVSPLPHFPLLTTHQRPLTRSGPPSCKSPFLYQNHATSPCTLHTSHESITCPKRTQPTPKPTPRPAHKHTRPPKTQTQPGNEPCIIEPTRKASQRHPSPKSSLPQSAGTGPGTGTGKGHSTNIVRYRNERVFTSPPSKKW